MSALVGVETKIERAKEHYIEMREGINQYLSSKPYHVDIEKDDSGRAVYRLRVDTPPPPRLSAMAGDVVHNLRAALDHLAWALVEANGGTPSRGTEYPIASSKKDLPALAKGRLKGASNRSLQLTRRFKPYKGGTEGFWQLHQLDIRDKHRLLFTLVASNESVVLNMSESMRKLAREAGHDYADSIPDMPIGIRPADPCVRDGEPLFVGSEDEAPELVEKFDMSVAIDEAGVVDCARLDESLDRLGGFVAHVVGVYRRRCFP